MCLLGGSSRCRLPAHLHLLFYAVVKATAQSVSVGDEILIVFVSRTILQGLQRLASAWQAVPIRQPPAPLSQAAAYALTASGPPLLYAVGGCHPDVLQCWDLTSEVVMQQVGEVGSHQDACNPDVLPYASCDSSLLLQHIST